MSELLHEFTDSRGLALRVDREESLLRGVKLLGLVSRNGRRYLESTLASAASLYEHAKVNINHADSGVNAPRSYRDRLGVIRNVRLRSGEGLFGDLHFNPKHPVAEQLLWDAEHVPENVGLSHNVLAETEQQTGETVVKTITKVLSVDLVADPATTDGLYENTEPDESLEKQAEEGDVAKGANAPEEPSLEIELNGDGIEISATPLERREQVYALLAEHALPLPDAPSDAANAITSEAFLKSLWAAADEKAVRQLIQERAAVVQAARTWRNPANAGLPPVARDQAACGLETDSLPCSSARSFVAAIKGN